MATSTVHPIQELNLDELAKTNAAVLAVDTNYDNRTGFDQSFLGSDSLVPLPIVPTNLLDSLATNPQPIAGQPPYILNYDHFSIAMHKDRKLAIFTAVNIDGKQFYGITRTKDHWVADSRIGKEFQTNDDLYAENDFDRGHLVRRQDPSWGSADEAIKANNDTFHFTNCSPQHKDFNQKATYWAGLENYILDNAKAANQKVCVFTGPVFRADDTEYRGVKIPKKFWKVVVILKPDGNFSATGYVVSQAEMLSSSHLTGFIFGQFRTYQVTIENIENLTGLNFGRLSEFDPLAPVPTKLLTAKMAAQPKIELSSFEDILF